MFYTQSAVRDLYPLILFKSLLKILIVWLTELHGKAGHFMVWANGKKKILGCETKVEKSVCLRRLAKFSLRSKRFQSSYWGKSCGKNKFKIEWGGGGKKRKRLPANPMILSVSPLLLPPHYYFLLSSQLSRRTRAETLATQTKIQDQEISSRNRVYN